MNNRTGQQQQILEYISNNQEIYTRILDNLYAENRNNNRRVNNQYMYRTILNATTYTESRLVDRYFEQRSIFSPRYNNYNMSNLMNSINNISVPDVNNNTDTVQVLDISGNVTFTDWSHDETTVPVDASGESIPIERCPITQQEFSIGDRIGRINRCGHVFSEHALRRWLRTNNSCPLCRQTVDPSFNFLEVRGVNINRTNPYS